MIPQLGIGTALIVASILIAGGGFPLLETVLERSQPWLLRPPHAGRVLALLSGAVLWFLLILTAAVWLWAAAFLALDLFATLEAAVYFSVVAFTTLGFGDIPLPQDWRLLAGMAAVNGLLMIGFQTAVLIEVLRRVRRAQERHRKRNS